MVKYKEIVQEMLNLNRDLFISFKDIHDKYSQNPKQYQDEFNDKGQEVLRIIQRWENILCGKSEAGKYGKFSTGLSEKYWTEIKSMFPLIDRVGEIVE